MSGEAALTKSMRYEAPKFQPCGRRDDRRVDRGREDVDVRGVGVAGALEADVDVRLGRLALDARELLVVRGRLLEAVDLALGRVRGLEDDLDRLLVAFGERDALLEELVVALVVALGVDDVIARVDGDALLEERLPHRDAVEGDLDARRLLRQEQLHVRDARQELGDARLRRALEVFVAVADTGAERVLRLAERVDELAGRGEAGGEVQLHIRVIFELQRGLILLDAELRVARFLGLDRLLRELEGARVRPATVVGRRGRGRLRMERHGERHREGGRRHEQRGERQAGRHRERPHREDPGEPLVCARRGPFRHPRLVIPKPHQSTERSSSI